MEELILAYSYLIIDNGEINGEQFADVIEKHYDCKECPQNKAFVEWVRNNVKTIESTPKSFMYKLK